MTYPIIITICSLVLLAYVFNITSSKTRIPSVVVLLLIGWLARQIANYFQFSIPDLNPILPIIGAVGLILIVLEGALDLEFEKGKNKDIFITAGTAFFSILFLCLILGGILCYGFGYSWQIALVNAIPLTIISSSVAIPAAQNLGNANRKFVVLDSSISDILGIVAFYFFANNGTISSQDFLFFANILLLIVVAFAASIALLLLLNYNKNHVKFIPMVLMVILLYSIAELFHLPALIFILIFGVILGNLDYLRMTIKENKYFVTFYSHLVFKDKLTGLRSISIKVLEDEIKTFKQLNIEITFLIRSLFFLLFGYLIDNAEIADLESLGISGIVILSIIVVRALVLKLFNKPLTPLLYLVPRGLITILLFLTIPIHEQIPLVNKSLIIQVIVLSSILMMIGLIFTKPVDNDVTHK